MCTCSISSGGGSTCVLFRPLRCQWLSCLSQAVWVPSSFLFFSLIWFCFFTLIKSTLSCKTRQHTPLPFLDGWGQMAWPFTFNLTSYLWEGACDKLLQKVFSATHMTTHSYAYNRIFLPVSLCTCKAVSTPHPSCRGHLKYPRCKQSRLQNQTRFLQRPVVHKGQTRTFLLRRPALQGKSTSHILMRKRPFLFS